MCNLEDDPTAYSEKTVTFIHHLAKLYFFSTYLKPVFYKMINFSYRKMSHVMIK